MIRITMAVNLRIYSQNMLVSNPFVLNNILRRVFNKDTTHEMRYGNERVTLELLYFILLLSDFLIFING